MDSTYNAQITVGTSHFQSQVSKFEFKTFAKPGEPLLQMEERDKNALGVSITPPTFTGGRLKNCTVAGPKDSCVIPYEENSKTMRCEIKNLKSGTKYKLEAYCCNVMLCGKKRKIEMVTRPSPAFRGFARVEDDITNSTIPLTLPKLINTGETKSNLVVVVQHIPKDGQNQTQDLRNESLKILSNHERNRRGKNCGESTWIAAVLPGKNEMIEVGDGEVYGGFYNCPLEQGESYVIGVLGITDMQGDPKYRETVWQQLKEPVKMTTQPGPNEHLLLVIVSVAGALLLFIVLALIIVLRRD
ncbi:receptor-type tyrosine-protein phosphatase delta-like [Macrobrachium rosenbergii]|uniref:receptor-type tyrosine-protein phosphatase delta-like n=1 Tax=Macrobrachium rosenbergii TaxID=79674 RepID=UPI0034D48E3C